MKSSIRYRSTRGNSPVLDFEQVVLTGLASDGGLYVPDSIPQFSSHQIASMNGISYPELALRLIHPFVGDAISEDELLAMLGESYREFRHRAIAPLKQIGNQEWVLELFHGPTLAFKDFALQFLGRLISHILKKRNEKVMILGATSGDTGSAAIAGCRGRDNMEIVILYPQGRTSDVQRRQMTTVEDENVHCVAINGTFDDCQRLVKQLFVDSAFREKHNLTAVNSINWARILAQVVYYFYAALQLGAPARTFSFSVPTGNFGDIYAGYLARRMGLPIETLLIASNRNDILTRTVETGEYKIDSVFQTLSPSMDIQVSSNFERQIYDLYGGDAEATRAHMQSLAQQGSFTLSDAVRRELATIFSAVSIDDAETSQTIRDIYQATGELLDPHTAVGVAAARKARSHMSKPYITLSTAHPAKFPDAVKAATGVTPELPPHMESIFEKKERFTSVQNDVDALKSFIEKRR
ncbi:MAG: threonine synthase [Rickettsiales bacterium]